MKVKELAAALGISEPDFGGDSEVSGVYCCDLLSRVMTGCQAGDAWITVQTHLNVAAVAELNEAACVILPESIIPEEALKTKACQNDIAVLTSDMTAYELCWRIHELLL